jgi:hypothetical protein
MLPSGLSVLNELAAQLQVHLGLFVLETTYAFLDMFETFLLVVRSLLVLRVELLRFLVDFASQRFQAKYFVFLDAFEFFVIFLSLLDFFE